MSQLHTDLSVPLVEWQVPVGNQYFLSENNTTGHFQDNRVEYFLAHPADLTAAGITAVLIGKANSGQTNYTDNMNDGITNPAAVVSFQCNLCNNHTSAYADDDGGYLRIFLAAYYNGSPPPPPSPSPSPSPAPSCLAAAVPMSKTASSTKQYSLADSDGVTWQEIDTINLRLTCAPTANQSTLLTANADLWTANAGFNQDLGIFVSDNAGADELLAWKESGGFAGTYSPNAAYVQSQFSMTSGHTYVFKLKWKTNKPAGGATIYAAAGSAPVFSPTSLIAQILPAAPNVAVSTRQYTLANSDGSTWQSIDATNLSTALSSAANATAVLGANGDLWTANAGFNQDIGIFVSDNGGADSLVAWKESGGFAGTYSPNAAFVKATYAMTGGHSYVFKLKWKTNKNADGAIIFAAAGNGPVYSPTSLFAQTIATGVNPYSAVSASQYSLSNSDGVNWQPIDAALNVTVAPGADTNSFVGGNVDLWTANGGFNQDIGIFVSDNGGADSLLAWKESGGFAGTYSPNAAFVQASYQMTNGHTYVFKLKWKTNKPPPGAVIFAAAGGPAPYSPTRLTVELTS
jgi:hypothetical protein